MLERSKDPFWDVKDRERAEEQRLQGQIDSIKASIEIGRRVGALQHATGFSDFVSAVRSMRDKELSDLAGDSRLTNEGLREKRGRVSALDDILGLLTRPAVNATLAEQLLERQNLLAEALKRRPQPKPKPQEAT